MNKFKAYLFRVMIGGPEKGRKMECHWCLNMLTYYTDESHEEVLNSLPDEACLDCQTFKRLKKELKF